MQKYPSIAYYIFLLIMTTPFLTLKAQFQKMELHTKAKPVNAVVNNSILEGSSVLNDPNRFIWGGSVVKGSDNKYHMLYNTWHCGDSIPKFSDSWVLHSEIAYAISDKPDRDFVFQKIVLKGAKSDGNAAVWDAQMVTNPHIKQFGNTYYLYYVGSKDPGIQQENSDGKGINKRNRVQQMLRIGVIEFNSFEDLVAENFTRPKEPLLAPRTRVKPNNIIAPSPPGTSPKPDNIIVVNPSIVRRPVDGKYLMYFKGNLYDPNWRGVHGVAISDNPSGPFVPKDDIIFDFKMEDGRLASAEDPYVWYHNTLNRFYAVFKDFSGKITGSEPGLALLESLDGLQWTKPTNPFFMKKEVTLINGDIIKLNRLERPQLLIDANGNPQVLYAAGSIVNINPRQDGSSFNIQIPIEAYVK